MKKMILLVTAFVCSVVMVSAQTDTTRQKNKTMKSKPMHKGDSAWHKAYPTKDMVKVKTADVPTSLRATLQGTEYTGWETGTVYQNSKTKEYALQLQPTSSSATSPKHHGWFRFDAQGKAIPEQRMGY